MSTSKEEFSKVQFEPQRDDDDDSESGYHSSDMESAVTDREEDPDEAYAVDAIKYAYWLKRKGQKAQWYYGILWGGYLKTESEMDIPSSGMDEHENLREDQVYQFWTSFNPMEVPTARLKPGHREPPEPHSKALKYPHRFDCPTQRIKEWFKDTEPRRLLSTFIARRQYIQNHSDRPHLTPVPKKYSDYYVHKKELRRKAREEKRLAKLGRSSSTALTSVSKDAASSRPGSTAANPKPPSPKEVAKPSTMDIINTLADPPSPTMSGLSELDSASEAEEVVEVKGSPTSKPKRFSPVPATKKRKEAPASVPSSTKKTKATTASTPKPSTVIPTPSLPVPTSSMSRLSGLGKIKKKKGDEEPLFEPAPSPGSTTVDSHPPYFGEPMSGIFDPDSPEQSASIPSVSVLPPTPAVKSVPEQSTSSRKSKSPTEGSSPALASSSKSDSKPVLSLRERTMAILSQQALAADAKRKADAALEEAAKETEVVESATISSNDEPEPKKEDIAGSSVSPSLPAERTLPGASLDVTSRPKYQQPVRMKFLDAVVDHKKKKAPNTSAIAVQAGPSRSPYGQAAVRSPLHPSAVRSPVDPRRTPLSGNKTPPHLSASTSTAQQSASTPAIPTGPRASFDPPTQYPTKRSGSLPDQKASYTMNQSVRPPPAGPKALPAGLPARPSPAVPPAPHQPLTGFVPRQAAEPPISVAIDPRRGALSPAQPSATSLYNMGADPRRRNVNVANLGAPAFAAGGMSPSEIGAFASPRSPSRSRDSRKFSNGGLPAEKFCEFRADVPFGPNAETHLRLGLFKGSTLPGAEHLQITRFFLNSPNSTLKRISMEEVDDICLTGILNLGGQVIEWSRASHVQENVGLSASRGEYESLKDKIEKSRKAFVTYTEFMPEQGVSNHYAIVLGSPDAVDLRHVGMGTWPSKEDIKIGLFIVALPLTSVSAPRLPNPVKPSLNLPPSHPAPSLPPGVPVLQSYGLDHDFFTTLSGTKVMKYPNEDGPTDVLHNILISNLKQYNAIPASEVDTLLMMNNRFHKTLKSGSIRANMTRRTAFYTYGPSLHLYPSQWTLTRVWQKGGLITFSPTFILRNPEVFADIMQMIRTVDSWAAYIVPGVIEWCKESWDKPLRCPNPTKAFEELSRSLFSEQHVTSISGPVAPTRGGLSVSCAPPVIHNADGCRRWMDWLRRITDEGSFDELVDLCKGITAHDFTTTTQTEKTDHDLELIDIERSQMEDLVAMRSRPHLLPYRRYIYIGGTALADEIKSQTREVRTRSRSEQG